MVGSISSPSAATDVERKATHEFPVSGLRIHTRRQWAVARIARPKRRYGPSPMQRRVNAGSTRPGAAIVGSRRINDTNQHAAPKSASTTPCMILFIIFVFQFDQPGADRKSVA